MSQYNKIVSEKKTNNTITKLYKRFDNSFYIIKRDLNGKILKTNMNISYGDNSSTNRINAVNIFDKF